MRARGFSHVLQVTLRLFSVYRKFDTDIGSRVLCAASPLFSYLVDVAMPCCCFCPLLGQHGATLSLVLSASGLTDWVMSEQALIVTLTQFAMLASIYVLALPWLSLL